MAVGSLGPATRGPNPTRPEAIGGPGWKGPPLTPPYGWFALFAVRDFSARVMIRLGDGAWTVVPDSYGGWVMEPRPKAVALTQWEGGVPIAVTGSFTIGSLRDPNVKQTERDCIMLERLAGRGGNHRPPVLFLTSNGVIPHDYKHAPHARWFIEDLAWNADEECRDRRGRRKWCVGSLVLRQYVQDETLTGLTAATKRNRDDRGVGPSGPSSRSLPNRVTARKGDTLRRIAKRLNMNAGELRDMKRLNDIRDADKVLREGRVIRLPKISGSR